MVFLLVFMHLTRDLFAIAKLLFNINFDTILTGFNSNREMPNCPLDTFYETETYH